MRSIAYKVDEDLAGTVHMYGWGMESLGRASLVRQPKKRLVTSNSARFKAAVGDHVDSGVAIGNSRVRLFFRE